MSNESNERRQGRIWLLTIPADLWSIPETLPESVAYIKGQKEIGSTTSFEHWQIIAYYNKSMLKILF